MSRYLSTDPRLCVVTRHPATIERFEIVGYTATGPEYLLHFTDGTHMRTATYVPASIHGSDHTYQNGA